MLRTDATRRSSSYRCAALQLSSNSGAAALGRHFTQVCDLQPNKRRFGVRLIPLPVSGTLYSGQPTLKLSPNNAPQTALSSFHEFLKLDCRRTVFWLSETGQSARR